MRLPFEEHAPVVLGAFRARHDLVGTLRPAAYEDLRRVGETAARGVGEEQADASVAADVQCLLREGE